MSHLPRLLLLAAGTALVALLAAVAAPRSALADHPDAGRPDCGTQALGELASEPGVPLAATGRWSTEDCDSRFRAGSDAHTYGFELAEPGRVRIDLRSLEADAYLYLLAEDGSRIEDDDDGAAGTDARIERDLEPGSYLVEATTVGGRARGPAGFSLSVVRLSCEPVDLGELRAGADLTASGTWTLEACGSRIVPEHPAYNYAFTLPQAGRVRIDLESEDGDPVLSLASPGRGVIGANDDGGDYINSRIEQYLHAGPYLIEATTYRQRDIQSLLADFTLTVHLVDEAAAQRRHLLKIEQLVAPEQVIAGDPFPVHYRVGNIGGGDLPEDADVVVYAVGPYIAEALRRLPPPLFRAGASHHSGAPTASATSTAARALGPFSVTWWTPGSSWVFVAVRAWDDDGDGEEIAFHGIWRNVRVIDGPTFGPVAVTVNGAAYVVTAADDDEGEVTTTVEPASGPASQLDPGTEAMAAYAAAVSELVLGGLFERPAIAALPTTADPAPVSLRTASSSTLLDAVAGRYLAAIGAQGLADGFGRGEAIGPPAVEDLTRHLAGTAAAEYAHLAASWSALAGRVAGGGALSFAEARALQAELAYAERVLAPAIAAGEIVEAARAAEAGWDDRAVAARLRALARQGSCDASSARGALEAAGAGELWAFAGLDRELRAALPAHGAAVDAALCAAAGVDAANRSFLRRLGLTDPRLAQLDAPRPLPPAEPPPPEPWSLRIIARVADDGRVEHGVELAGGEQVLPRQRYLGAEAAVGRWHLTSEIEVAGVALGQVRARRLGDGRLEWGFLAAGGEEIAPDVRFLAPGAPAGVWFRSTPIEVLPPEAPEE